MSSFYPWLRSRKLRQLQHRNQRRTEPTRTELPPPVPKPSFGIQIDPNTDDLSRVLRWVQGMGFGWIKVQVQWAIIEQQPGVYRWTELDGLVNLSNDFEFDLLLGVVDAPGWLRAEPGYNGPPHDPAEFERFMAVLASHYAGKVTAYELWNEPNLQREWYGETLDPAAFVALIAAGSRGVRQGDSQALVISAASGVTGIDDGLPPSTTAGSCANRSRPGWHSGWMASACIRTATAIPRGNGRWMRRTCGLAGTIIPVSSSWIRWRTITRFWPAQV